MIKQNKNLFEKIKVKLLETEVDLNFKSTEINNTDNYQIENNSGFFHGFIIGLKNNNRH
jgi:hypothetical protein